MTRYFCCDERRREAIRATGVGNGIDFLEVVDGPDLPLSERQRLLRVNFVNPPSALLQAIEPDQVHITGGVRVTGVQVVPPLTFDGDVLVIRVDRPGDFSTYTLTLGEPDSPQIDELDRLLSSVDFSFKVECPSGFDCAGGCVCAPEPADEPEIDYLALDYASFRQLMLDRLTVTAPGWQERNPADLGIALVEVLAYAADHVGYQLDATGMEASLGSARLRTSVRRHARAVDYRVHEGSNARTWVHFEVTGSIDLPAGTQLLSEVPGLPRMLVDPSPEYTQAIATGPVIFETMERRILRDTLNKFDLYAWGDRECCLPAGATSATLSGRHDDLHAGDVLVFVEYRGPRSGSTADADPSHRHVVRLTAEPVFDTDPLSSWFDDPTQPLSPLEVTEITWGVEDALPFAVCVSATDRNGDYHQDVSHLLGNLVLADHGRSRTEDLLEVPEADPRLAYPAETETCKPDQVENRAARYTPVLRELDLTMAGTIGRSLPGQDEGHPARFDPAASASAALAWQDRHVLPEIYLLEAATDERWEVRRDLLATDRFVAEFVAETEAGGITRLRFGDGEYGKLPRAKAKLTAHYRTGNGTAGNVGADALWHVVTTLSGFKALRNPLPARGGTDPEPLDRVRRNAPVAFRVQERAVTPEDYAAAVRRHPEVQQAVCVERWTGSWYSQFITIDRTGGLPVDEDFEAEIRRHLERFRMAGHDLEIVPPQFVALQIVLRVCVLPDYYRADVQREVLTVLGAGRTPEGRPRFFHPDNFTFGSPIYLSALLAAVQGVQGVRYVEPKAFRRLGVPRSDAIEDGVLRFAALEIPRLDNDRNFPDRGTLTLEMEGGR